MSKGRLLINPWLLFSRPRNWWMGCFWVCLVFSFLNLFLWNCYAPKKREKKLRKDLHDPYLQGLCNKNMQIPWSCLCSISLYCYHPHFPKIGERYDRLRKWTPKQPCEPLITAVAYVTVALIFVLVNTVAKVQSWKESIGLTPEV